MRYRRALTDAAIRNAKAADKDIKLWDGGGLYLLITKAGSRLWRFKYRLHGAERLMALGSYPAIGLRKARELHEEASGLVQTGQDPVAARRVEEEAKQAAKLAAKTFSDVATEWLAFKAATSPADKTKDRRERMVRYLKLAFGADLIGDLRVRHLSNLLAGYEKAGKFETRARLQGIAVEIMGYAVGRSYIGQNPFVGVRFTAAFTAPSETREKRPAIVEAEAFGHLLRKVDQYEGRSDNIVGFALRLLALTFVRPGELAGAQWAHFDLDHNRKWTIPFAELKMRTERKKNDKRVNEAFEVPLSLQAIKLLRELRKVTGHSRFLFPSRGGRTLSTNALEIALKAMGYQNIHCPHGFRSSASTLLNKERVDGRRRFERALIEIQLDHVDDSTRAVYDRSNLWDERVELMQFWADKIDAMKAISPAVSVRAA